jgi:hypothetical protein
LDSYESGVEFIRLSLLFKEAEMIWKRIGWILLLALSACTNSAPTATPTLTVTLAPSATTTPTQPPTRMPTPGLFVLAKPIHYNIHKDIWVNLPETVENGEPAFFKFSGVGGQEIYINTQYQATSTEGWIEETKVFEQNGDLIQASRTQDLGGWIGKLPSTQEYLISLIPVDNQKAEFTLQFVNTPPRQESGYFTYFDEQNGFEITYAQDDFVPVGNDIPNHHVFSVAMDTDKYFPDTILQMSHLTLSIGPECIEPYDPDFAVNETINGIPFKKFVWNDAATGTGAELVFYSTIHNNQCYQFFIRTLYIRVDKFPDTDKKDFSRSVLYTKYYRLLNTFKFIE